MKPYRLENVTARQERIVPRSSATAMQWVAEGTVTARATGETEQEARENLEVIVARAFEVDRT